VTRGWKIAIGAIAAIVALNLALRALDAATGGTPGGPASSSYATGNDGARAYAELLARAGHEVRRERSDPHAARLAPNETAVVLDPPFVLARDVDALRTFVAAGGRLVASPGGSRWLRRLDPHAPLAGAGGVEVARPLAPVAELGGVHEVRTAGDRSWLAARGAVPALGSTDRSVLAVAALGRGRELLLADPSPLQNGLLGRADNARLALALAGPPSRPVVFFERYHGYGTGSGLSAIPGSWQALLVLGALAAIVFMLARVRRLGPPEEDERALDPPRREYVEALAATLARTSDRERALDPVRSEVRRRVTARSGLRPDASDEQLAAAARRLELGDDEVRALLGPAGDNAATLALGRALARLGEGRGGWRN
jgi:hypothetical protein